jgi:molybdate transport repressor ModE-like protein
MKLDPRAVRLFLAVCRAGSISNAAREENLSQPSVSVAMAQLEHRIGAKLFERHRSGIRLTPAGSVLRARAEAMDNILDAALREIRLVDTGIAGPLVVGGTPGALATVVPPTIARLKRDYPQFELRVIERSDRDVMELLRTEQIDIAVVTAGMDERPPEFVELPLVSDAFSLIVGKAHDDLPSQLSLHDLGGMRWVLPEVLGAFRRQIDALFVSADMAMPRNIIRCDSLLTTKEIVRRTDYVTILPRGVTTAEVAVGTLRSIRIEEAAIERRVGLLWLGEHRAPPIAAAFVEHAKHLADP